MTIDNDVSALIQKSVAAVNEARQRNLENEVTSLVNKIMTAESELAKLAKDIVGFKAQLIQLKLPPVASLTV